MQWIIWMNMAYFCPDCWMSRSKRPCERRTWLETLQAEGSQPSPLLCPRQSNPLLLVPMGHYRLFWKEERKNSIRHV